MRRETQRTDTEEQPAWVPGMAEAPVSLVGPAMEIVDMRSDAQRIKERHTAYMAAAFLWFLLISLFIIAGSGVLRIASHIL